MPRVCRIIALTLPRADLTGSPGVQQLTSGCHCHGRAPRTKGWPRPGRITALDVPISRTCRKACYPPKNVDLGRSDSPGFLGAACNRISVC